ncbi:MAG: hypothetical protein ACRDRU_15765 [Pseudonocardiaceae bacterium]
MTDEVHRRLSDALRAQASGMGSGPVVLPGRGPAHAKPRLSAAAVLALAMLSGAMVGGLAGAISAW